MKDKRLDSIHKQIIEFTANNFEAKGQVSEKGDEIDAIVAGLNTLGQELQEQKLDQQDREKRKTDLLEILLKYTMLDFSEKASLSEKGDEIDAIAAGLNAMGDEIIYFRDELQKKARDLEEANNELESFTYSVSHDLRAPLRALHGYSQILVEDHAEELTDESNRILSMIMQNAKKMGTLIDNLLSYTRIGKTNFSKSSVNVDAMVKNIVADINISQKHHADITIHPLGKAKADYTLLSLVFQNLITNAIKYSAKEENPEIEVGVKKTDKGKKTFFVKDNGVGFDMNYYDKVFGVFQRLHRAEEFEGNGVGLAIVQRIITRHGGEIWAEAEVGKGAEFNFTLG